MKIYILLLSALILGSCKKENHSVDLTEITYEIQTTVAGFVQVRYIEYNPAVQGTNYIDWNITTPGTHTKKVMVMTNTLAEISAVHPSSNSWKLAVKSSSGSLLKETNTINFFAGPPSNYYASCGVAAQ